MQEQNEQFFCPSFSTYSSDKLSELAGRVSAQYDDKYEDDDKDGKNGKDSRFNDDDFEFSLVQDDSANEIIIEGKIRPIFPIFNRDLLLEDLVEDSMENSMQSKINSSVRLPLENMFVENEAASCSSSEADELETVAPGTYCVWRPKIVESNRCKKSNSTGSTPKRWSFLNLLRRSNSEGKDSLVFLTPKNRGVKSVNNEKVENLKARRNSDVVQVAGKVKPKGVSGGEKASAHEAFYVQNRAMKEGFKRKSYLPYRQDLVGFFANVGALGPAAKAFPPF